MDKKNCLNCKWEPEWDEWIGTKDYRRCHGHCRFPVKIQLLPKVYTVVKKKIVRYNDDSGVMEICHTWEAKDAATAQLV